MVPPIIIIIIIIIIITIIIGVSLSEDERVLKTHVLALMVNQRLSIERLRS